MLMDEPFSGLDVQLRDSMQEETLSLLRETRATCMIVTHQPEEAMRLGDRVAVMRGGRLVQAGKAEELYHRPAELFVARLFSEINEIRYRVKSGAIDTPIGTFGCPEGTRADAPSCACASAAISCGRRDKGLPGRVLHVKLPGRCRGSGDRRRRVSISRCGRVRGERGTRQRRRGRRRSRSAASVLVFPAGGAESE